MAWLGRHFSVRVNPGDDPRAFLLYYLYGLERTGRLTNQRFIGRHDWYREGADWLINLQEDISGFWRGTGLGENDSHIGTSLALLFLAKGRRPIVTAKIRHGPQEDWNHHRRDVANLVSYTEKRWQRDLTWQVIDVDAATSDDLIEAPVLYLNGEQAPELSDDDVTQNCENTSIAVRLHLCRTPPAEGAEFDRGFRVLIDRIVSRAGSSIALVAEPRSTPSGRPERRAGRPAAPRPAAVGGRRRLPHQAVMYCPGEPVVLLGAGPTGARVGAREEIPDRDRRAHRGRSCDRRERHVLRHESRAEIQARSAATVAEQRAEGFGRPEPSSISPRK